MSDPFFRALTPDGRTAVEVRMPEDADDESTEVLFTCTVTIDGTTVIADLETSDQHKMVLWVKKQMGEVMRRTA